MVCIVRRILVRDVDVEPTVFEKAEAEILALATNVRGISSKLESCMLHLAYIVSQFGIRPTFSWYS